MKIVRIGEVPKVSTVGPIDVGPVTRQDLALDSQENNVRIVNFSKGARNKFHSHSNEQLLIVTAGRGIVATEKEERVVSEGDVILFPAGEKHWHGATFDSEFSHIYVMRRGAVLTKLED